MRAKHVLELLGSLGIGGDASTEEIKLALSKLFSEVNRADGSAGVEIEEVDVDGDTVCVRLLAASRSVALFFFVDENGVPTMGVNWDGSEDEAAAFDLSDLQLKYSDNGLIDVASINSWMDQTMLMQIVMDPDLADGIDDKIGEARRKMLRPKKPRRRK